MNRLYIKYKRRLFYFKLSSFLLFGVFGGCILMYDVFLAYIVFILLLISLYLMNNESIKVDNCVIEYLSQLGDIEEVVNILE